MKLWGGRFTGQVNELMKQFNDSFHFDRRLYAEDINGSIIYAGALHKIDLLNDEEYELITTGLANILREFRTDSFEYQPSDEDIHTAVERRLTELIGPIAGKLHTGRSRNDQVALDLRLWCMKGIEELTTAINDLQSIIVGVAETHTEKIMPGYTHRQLAQPILFSHWLLSYFWMLQRDKERFSDTLKRTALSPLGSGAIAGTPYPVDRMALAGSLNMTGISQNSIDAVSDRDFIAEFLFNASMTGMHLSRLAEDLILFSGEQPPFIRIDDSFTTGSSLMPQKRNPDSLELIRGKTGRLTGTLMSLLITLKSLPSSYNKDLQEDKEPMFESFDHILMIVQIMTLIINSMDVNGEAMRAALSPEILATDMADYLVKRGVPFRESHHLVGLAVILAEEKRIPIKDLSLDELKRISPVIEDDILDIFEYRYSVEARDSIGGTATKSVQNQLQEAKKLIKV